MSLQRLRKSFLISNLKELILQNFYPSSGKLLYVSGEIITSDLDKDLLSNGYKIERIITYLVKPVKNLDIKFVQKLKSNMPDIVYVYSQNSALNFARIFAI